MSFNLLELYSNPLNPNLPYEILFSKDTLLYSVPYLKQNKDIYLITGEKCVQITSNPHNYFEYLLTKLGIEFRRDKTRDEWLFLRDYNAMKEMKQLTKLRNYTLVSKVYFPVQILNQFREQLINEFQSKNIKKQNEKLSLLPQKYTQEESNKRLTKNIQDYEYHKELSRINAKKQKEMNKLDKQYNPEKYEEHQKQLKPAKPELNKTFNLAFNITGYPYRSTNKLKSLYDEYDETKVKHYNDFNVKESKKKYSLKAFSKIPHSYIGDIFFEGKDFAFLLLININTRYAYAYKLGDVEEKEIINIDENRKEYEIKYATKGQKTIKSLKKAFNQHLKHHPINMLRFDGERAIGSYEFQEFLKKKNIKFVETKLNSHTSLSIIDRLCRTIRDIAFNLNIELDNPSTTSQSGSKISPQIVNQAIMDKILNYYNEARHDTLTQTLFKAYPELKSKYKFISPSIMEHNPELEKLFVKECVKYNFFISSQNDFELNKNDIVKIVSNEGKLGKRRAILDKDDYKVVDKVGNVYELKNVRTGEKIYKPRFEIKI